MSSGIVAVESVQSNNLSPLPWEEGARFPFIPNTPSDPRVFFDELTSLNHELRVVDTLQHLVVSVESISWADNRSITSDAKYFILTMELGTENTQVLAFYDSVEASDYYLQLEKEHLDNSAIQHVLVAADSVTVLRRAFPNYFNDAALFIGAVQSMIRSWEEFQSNFAPLGHQTWLPHGKQRNEWQT
jgi:hypothetical protein